jgi:hypothetical protein
MPNAKPEGTFARLMASVAPYDRREQQQEEQRQTLVQQLVKPVAPSPAPAPGRKGPPSLPAAPTRQEEPLFDLTVEPYHKDTFAFTNPELEVIQQIKLKLCRLFPDARVKKDDIIRTALGMLKEDVDRNDSKSLICQKLASRSSK